MDNKEEIQQAKKCAMSILQRMDRTEWELIDKLKKKEFSPEAIQEALEYVRSFHYIDDQRYANHFVEIYHEQRSVQRLKQDLYKRHVSSEIIGIALEHIQQDDGPGIQKALEKLLRGKESLTYEEKQKIIAKLYRKGFQVRDIQKELEKIAQNWE